jgi:uncharacterized damage-inducible protein DinB
MFRQIDDFIPIWQYEIEATLKYINNLTDESLTAKPHEHIRSAGFLVWHILHTTTEMMNRTGLQVAGSEQTDYNGETVAQLAAAFKESAESLITELQTKWTDESLQIKDEMYGEQWKRGSTLGVLTMHLAHHRGQLSIVMRMLGLPVPGVYGPSQEEWLAWGKEPMR